MPTDDERQEVAENLRIMTVYGCRYAEQFYELLQEAVMSDSDFHSFTNVADRLADLIEPEPKRTTRLELVATEVDKNGDALAVGVHCALCGLLDEEVVGADPDNWMLWRYCPSCGAEVV